MILASDEHYQNGNYVLNVKKWCWREEFQSKIVYDDSNWIYSLGTIYELAISTFCFISPSLGSPTSTALNTRIANIIEGGWGQPIWLSDVNCQGHETSLQDCNYQLGTSNNCNHDKDVVVTCACKYLGPHSEAYNQSGEVSPPTHTHTNGKEGKGEKEREECPTFLSKVFWS